MRWDLGQYERIAVGLLPAASVVVERAAPGARESVLDLGCGTGNAAIFAAKCGATVVGVDPAERLLQVARAETVKQGLTASFSVGTAEAIPMEKGSVDVVVSVFGMIFSSDATAAATEVARVCKARARVV